jgi:hypothetical protein
MFVRRGPLRNARMLARVTAGSLEAAERSVGRQCAPPEEEERIAPLEDRGSEAGWTGRSDLVAEPPKPERLHDTGA